MSRLKRCTNLCPLHNCPEAQAHDDRIFVPWKLRDSLLDQEVQAAGLYSPIKDWQTRVVRVHPGFLGQNLVLDLIVVDLIHDNGVVDHFRQEQLTYEALSYCWEDPVFCCNVTVNGNQYLITENLFSALQRLRSTEQPRCLWIDALCINQYDVDERSAQVRKMLKIFKKAERVLVWLGECRGVTSICLKYFAFVPDGLTPMVEIFAESCCSKHGHMFYLGLRELLGRPWFTRVWIRQEVWAARDIVVHCGSCTLPWERMTLISMLTIRFAETLQHDFSLRHNLENTIQGLKKGQPLAHATVEYPEMGKSVRTVFNSLRFSDQGSPLEIQLMSPGDAADLLKIMEAASHCQCTDKRDRVYGFLGMTTVKIRQPYDTHAESRALPIDYSRSVSEVFQDVARYFLLPDNSIDLLGLDASFGGLVDGERLPSWCPDWSQQFSGVTWLNKGHKHYLSKNVPEIHFDGSVLQFSGHIYGSIASVGSYTGEDGERRTCATATNIPFVFDYIGKIKRGDMMVLPRTPVFQVALILRRTVEGYSTFQARVEDDRVLNQDLHGINVLDTFYIV